MSFMPEEKHKGILNKQSEIWKRFKDVIQKDFDVEEFITVNIHFH